MDRRFADKPFPTRLVVVGFAAATATVVAVAAIAIGGLIKSGIRNEALAGAETSASLFKALALQPDEYDDRGRLTEAALEDIDRDVAASPEVLGARIWERGGTVAYDSGVVRGTAEGPPAEEVREAFEGELSSEVTSAAAETTAAADERGGGDATLVEVTLPVRRDARGPVRHALEVYLDFGSAKASIANETRTLYGVLAAVAVFMFLALLPLVRRAAHLLAQAHATRHGRLRAELGRAIRAGELELHYQPKASLFGGDVIGVEGLLRWRHPRHGIVPPLDYLPAAEEAGLMGPLTRHVLELAVTQAAAWRERGLDVPVAVNISSANLHERDLPGRIAALLDEHCVPPKALVIEITETTAMEECGPEVLAALHEVGVELALDDFGTGHSSLGRLDGLPITELKIDRRFVASLEAGGSAALLSTIVKLGHELGMRVVAEGVESDQVAAMLRDLGCDAAQGFWLTRPLPAAEMAGWIEDRAAERVAVYPR
jgi:EAL domain-containing protein (putative c-di-GMP-specific phosphodiesterase class I)